VRSSLVSVMQFPDPGLAVAERRTNAHSALGGSALSCGRERLLRTVKTCRGSSRMGLRRGF
jgi:hypothetical protein